MVSLGAHAEYGTLFLSRLDRASVKRAVTVEGHITANSLGMVRQLLLAGAGIGVMPDLLVQDDLKAKRLVRVLPLWEAPPVDAHVLVRTRTLLPQRVRLFLDHLVSHFGSS